MAQHRLKSRQALKRGLAVPQRILVPTDGSEFSRRVLPIVRRLAKAHGAQVAMTASASISISAPS